MVRNNTFTNLSCGLCLLYIAYRIIPNPPGSVSRRNCTVVSVQIVSVIVVVVVTLFDVLLGYEGDTKVSKHCQCQRGVNETSGAICESTQ